MYIVEAAKNPIIIKESTLKINNNTDLDDDTITKIFNKEYNNIIKETEKYIDKQYDLMYDKDNPAPMSLKNCKKFISEKIYNVEASTINSPKYGDIIYFDIWIDMSKAFAGHVIFCDYFVQLSTHKYIKSEFGMHG